MLLENSKSAGLGMIGTGLLTDPEEFADEPHEYEPTREGQAFLICSTILSLGNTQTQHLKAFV